MIAQLARAARLNPTDAPAQNLDRVEQLLGLEEAERAATVPLIAELLGVPWTARYGGLGLTAQRQKERTLEALVQWLG